MPTRGIRESVNAMNDKLRFELAQLSEIRIATLVDAAQQCAIAVRARPPPPGRE
jgi:hypothetical protein